MIERLGYVTVVWSLALGVVSALYALAFFRGRRENAGYRQLMTSQRVRGLFAYQRCNDGGGEIRPPGFAKAAVSTAEPRTKERV